MRSFVIFSILFLAFLTQAQNTTKTPREVFCENRDGLVMGKYLRTEELADGWYKHVFAVRFDPAGMFLGQRKFVIRNKDASVATELVETTNYLVKITLKDKETARVKSAAYLDYGEYDRRFKKSLENFTTLTSFTLDHYMAEAGEDDAPSTTTIRRVRDAICGPKCQPAGCLNHLCVPVERQTKATTTKGDGTSTSTNTDDSITRRSRISKKVLGRAQEDVCLDPENIRYFDCVNEHYTCGITPEGHCGWHAKNEVQEENFLTCMAGEPTLRIYCSEPAMSNIIDWCSRKGDHCFLQNQPGNGCVDSSGCSCSPKYSTN